jgi:DNA-directed RNA polymerase alpha subunit
MDTLKQVLEKSMKFYEEFRVELRDLVVLCDAQQVQIQSRDNLIAELKRVKGELEETLDKNETNFHQWWAQLARAYRHAT